MNVLVYTDENFGVKEGGGGGGGGVGGLYLKGCISEHLW